MPVEVRHLNEMFWLTQKEMAELFDVDQLEAMLAEAKWKEVAEAGA